MLTSGKKPEIHHRARVRDDALSCVRKSEGQNSPERGGTDFKSRDPFGSAQGRLFDCAATRVARGGSAQDDISRGMVNVEGGGRDFSWLSPLLVL